METLAVVLVVGLLMLEQFLERFEMLALHYKIKQAVRNSPHLIRRSFLKSRATIATLDECC